MIYSNDRYHNNKSDPRLLAARRDHSHTPTSTKMGLFNRRAKVSKRPEHGKFLVDGEKNHYKSNEESPMAALRRTWRSSRGASRAEEREQKQQRNGKRMENTLLTRFRNMGTEEATIGDQLAPEDQFYLEVPIKKRTRINGRLFLRGSKTEKGGSGSTASSVSSITHASQPYSKRVVQPPVRHHDPQLNNNNNNTAAATLPSSDRNCFSPCTACNGSDFAEESSVVGNGQGQQTRAPYKQPSFMQWLFSCGNVEEWKKQNPYTLRRHEHSYGTAETTPAYHRRQPQMQQQRPDNALFDGALLDDDESDSDTVGALEDRTADTKTSIWKRFKMRRKRSIPKLSSGYRPDNNTNNMRSRNKHPRATSDGLYYPEQAFAY